MAISAANLMVTFKADTKDAEQGIQRVNKGITGFAKSAAAMGAGVLGAQVFNTVARGFQGAGSAALDFGKNMANVNSIAQLSDGAFAKLNDQVLALTSDPRIAQAPATLAAGLYDIYSSGFQGADGLKVLQQSALAATAGVTDTATAARVITANLNAFGLGAGDAQRVSDVLFQTVNDGVITFEQLANNMGNVIPIANSLGLGVEDVGAAYAQMTLKGVPAAQAETQIAGLMRSALNPTDKLTAAVQAHGFASAASAIEQEGLAGFLDIVNDAAGGNQETMFDLLGTQEAMNAATILGADGAKNYRKELDKMKGASKGAGATNKALEKQMQSASFAIAKMKQQVLTLATVGFGILAPVIGRAAGAITSFISRGLIPLVNIFKRATSANFAFGKGFDKLIKGLPQPIRRAVHAIASLTDAISDMVRGGFSLNEITQAWHAVQALGQEIGKGVTWVANIVIDSAVSLAGWLYDHKDDIWGGIKSLAGWSLDKITEAVNWTLDVGAPAVASAIGDIGDWLNRFLFNQTNNQEVGPISWKLNLSLPSIGMPEAFASGQQAGEYIRRKLGAISADDVSWKLALAVPLILMGPPAVIGGLIVKKLTGIGPIKLTTWTLTVLAPATVAFAAGVATGLIPAAIHTALDTAAVAVKGFAAWTLNVAEASTLTVAWTAEQIATKIKTTIGDIGDIHLPVNFIVDLTIDVVKHVKTGAEGIWDFLTGHITPLSAGGMPGGGPGTEQGVNISQSFSVTATLDKAQWDADYSAIFNDVAAINGTTATAKATLNKADWGVVYDALFSNVNSINQTTATAKANLDSSGFTEGFDGIMAPGGMAEQLRSATFISHADLDISAFLTGYDEAFVYGNAFAMHTFTSAFDADNTGVYNAWVGATSLGDDWAGRVYTASFSIDTSGLWAALGTATIVAGAIAAIMPHSPAKKGPLSKPIRFDFIADAARRDLSGLGNQIEGYLGAHNRTIGARGGRAGGPHITVNALKSSELIRLMKDAETGGHFARNLGPELGMRGGF